MKTSVQGAQTSLHCALAELGDGLNQVKSGCYYADCKAANPTADANNMELAAHLWEVSCKLVGIPNEISK